MALCIAVRNGTLCTNVASKKSGYCKQCDPTSAIVLQREIEELRRKEARKDAEKVAKKEQRQEIQAEKISEAILEITDFESLRRLELMILQGLVDGSIDSRAGPAIVQLLKHQQGLIQETAKDRRENLSGAERGHAMAIAEKMSEEQMLGFLSDFVYGMKTLAKQARAAAIEAETIEVKLIDQKETEQHV